MPKQVALLRAINVGGRRVRMEDLREIFSDLGFSGARTYIASGNVIFDDPGEDPVALERKIEAALHARLGYEVDTFLRRDHELATIAGFSPFPFPELTTPTNTLYVTFLRDRPEQTAIEEIHAMRNPVDDLRIHDRELYWLRRRAVGESLIDEKRIARVLKMPGTNRNTTTVRKLAEMMGMRPPTAG